MNLSEVYDCSLYYSATFLCLNSFKIKLFFFCKEMAFGLKIETKSFKGKI